MRNPPRSRRRPRPRNPLQNRGGGRERGGGRTETRGFHTGSLRRLNDAGSPASAEYGIRWLAHVEAACTRSHEPLTRGRVTRRTKAKIVLANLETGH